MRFWTDHPEFADEVGCYICAIRAGRGYVPIYVGQATVGFRKECFDHHKLDHYNKARDIRDKKGTPVLFLRNAAAIPVAWLALRADSGVVSVRRASFQYALRLAPCSESRPSSLGQRSSWPPSP
jgi:hypothetical protein